MEDIQNKSQNKFNLPNFNQNNIINNQHQIDFNFNENNPSQFQSLNNNQFFTGYPQNDNNLNINTNFYFNPNDNNNKESFEQNKMFNNMNNNSISFTNNNISNDNKNNEKEKKSKNKKKSKNESYKSKDFNNNPNQNSPNINYPNQYNQFPFPNMFSNEQNINQNLFDKQKNNDNITYNPDNDIDNNFRNIISEIKKDESKINKDNTCNKVYKAYSYIFNSKMEEVINVMTDENIFKDDCPLGRIDNVQFPKDNFAKYENSIVCLRWKKFYEIKLISSNPKWSKTSISYTLKMVELKPENIGSLDINFKYYYNTCQNNTLFVIEYILDKGILSEVFKEEFLDIDMNDICYYCENIIEQRKKEKTHVSSLIINTTKEKAWNSLITLNKRRYVNYMNKYNLYYLTKNEGENKGDDNDDSNQKNYIIQKGDSIIIKKNNNELFCKLEIEDIKEEKDIKEISFNCMKSENQSQNENKYEKNNNKNIEVLNQKIILCIKEITKDICYFEYKHIWNDWIDINKIDSFDFLKTNSLKIFKQLLIQDNDETKKGISDDNSIPRLFNLICPTEP